MNLKKNLLVLALTFIHGSLHAQAPEGSAVEEIIVTARLSGENVHDLPFTVNVISGDLLQRKRMMSLEEALRSTPGVDVSSFGGFNDSNVRMRGMGSLFQISSEDSSVVLNVDGVPLTSRNATLGTMDIDRVEVLKGPQGTLFGRNSEAGAVNITSRRPTREFEGYARTQIGEEDQHVIEGAGGGPLTSSLSGRIAARNAGADSTVVNVQDNGNPSLRAKDTGVRGSLLWQPMEGTAALFITERQDQKGRAGLEVMRPYGEPPTQDITPGLQFGVNVQDRHSLEINHEVNGTVITSVTSYTRSESESLGCQSKQLATAVYGMPFEICQGIQAQDKVENQNLRWSSGEGATLFWVTGLNVSRSERRYDNDIQAFGSTNKRAFETRNQALFGEVTYPLSESLKLTGGLRHTWEDKDYRAGFLAGGFPSSDTRSLSDNYTTGRVALLYTLTAQTNLYGVLARGYKSGGFTDYTSQVADGVPLLPAVVNSLEFGFKSTSTDGRFTLSGAAFLNEAKDDHLLGYDPVNFASKGLNTDTESKGVEVEGSLRIGNAWTLTGGANYTDAEITRDVFGVSGGDVHAGNRSPDVARWSVVSTLIYRSVLPGFLGMQAPELDASVSYRFLGSRAADAQNHFDLAPNQKIDTRIALLSGNAEFFMWGDNLLDKRNELYAYYYASTVSTGMPSRGRTFGVGVNYQF